MIVLIPIGGEGNAVFSFEESGLKPIYSYVK